MRTTPATILREHHLPAPLLLALTLAWSGCGSDPPSEGPQGGAGGSGGTGGATGGIRADASSGGSGGGTGGGGGGGRGGSSGVDAVPDRPGTAASPDAGGGDRARDGAGAATGDGGTRPDAAGAACASGQNYSFTIRPFTTQTGTFTASFTARPSNAPTNSVIGLSDGPKYIHDSFAAIVRFGTSGNIDARNGAGYTSLTPLPYKVTDYHFRLVVNVPARTYSAYVSFDGMPEVTIGTDLAFRTSAGMPTQLNHWGVEAIQPHMTRVCGFLVH
jgi:hypothetical protein